MHVYSGGENNTRLDMRGNGQRSAPSILLDSCFELLGSYQQQAIDMQVKTRRLSHPRYVR